MCLNYNKMQSMVSNNITLNANIQETFTNRTKQSILLTLSDLFSVVTSNILSTLKGYHLHSIIHLNCTANYDKLYLGLA